jgi:signal transduction histidine kinase
LQVAIEEATRVYRNEAGRRNLEFKLNISESPKAVVGDPKKIKTVVANLTANSREPSICIICILRSS